MPGKSRRFGWVPDLPDQRDHLLTPISLTAALALPTSADLRPLAGPIFDQGDLGSCTANAVAQHIMMDLAKQQATVITPSRLFIYYQERVLENSVHHDAGAYLRDGIKVVAQYGSCLEKDWPYVIRQYAKKPPVTAYNNALQHQALEYLRVTQDKDQLRGCLAAGYPFVFGFSVYESFLTASVESYGDAPLPDPKERLLGGHAVVAVGYNDSTNRFRFANSWGADWGDGGFGTLPYAYLCNSNLADDIWTIRLMEG